MSAHVQLTLACRVCRESDAQYNGFAGRIAPHLLSLLLRCPPIPSATHLFLVLHQGETAASHDVTCNIERSKHLDDPQQAKIYKAEVSDLGGGCWTCAACVIFPRAAASCNPGVESNPQPSVQALFSSAGPIRNLLEAWLGVCVQFAADRQGILGLRPVCLTCWLTGWLSAALCRSTQCPPAPRLRPTRQPLTHARRGQWQVMGAQSQVRHHRLRLQFGFINCSQSALSTAHALDWAAARLQLGPRAKSKEAVEHMIVQGVRGLVERHMCHLLPTVTGEPQCQWAAGGTNPAVPVGDEHRTPCCASNNNKHVSLRTLPLHHAHMPCCVCTCASMLLPTAGAVPHDKPGTSKVHADQTTRFDGNKVGSWRVSISIWVLPDVMWRSILGTGCYLIT